jgi:hypothetical protein
MNVVTYGGARASAARVARNIQDGARRRFFARFMDALRETRLREARRIIERYAHLLPQADD